MQKHLSKCDGGKKHQKNALPSAKKLPFTAYTTSKSQQHQIDLQVTRFIIASNIAFFQTENQQLKKLVQMLKPGTRVPTRKEAGSPLMEELYAEERQKIVCYIRVYRDSGVRWLEHKNQRPDDWRITDNIILHSA